MAFLNTSWSNAILSLLPFFDIINRTSCFICSFSEVIKSFISTTSFILICSNSSCILLMYSICFASPILFALSHLFLSFCFCEKSFNCLTNSSLISFKMLFIFSPPFCSTCCTYVIIIIFYCQAYCTIFLNFFAFHLTFCLS